ncbi:MAG TPA: 4Fe-4S ferredoxin [Anaerolineae bacterium]|nr:4Fe-4S ferredoxin [Anaerolineae bacterium]
MDRVSLVRDAVIKLLDGGEVAGVLALRAAWPASAPHLYRAGDDLGDLVLWPKYSLPKILDRLLAAGPDVRLGMVTRGCEERGLIELAKHNQVDLGRIRMITVACTAEERDECRCAWPYPSRIDVGDKVEGIADAVLAEHEKLSLAERTEFWQQQFARCLKCYACRTACPQCFCETCALEDSLWVETGVMAPPFPSYHLIRAYHTVAKCVGCTECERACPADIPLTVLYTLLRRDAESMFGYVPGRSVEDQPPLVVETLW